MCAIEGRHHNVRLTIDYRPIVELKCYERTLRKRSKRYRQNMLGSVGQFGIVLPILINERSVILAGEGVFEAARELGIVEVPTTRIEHLDGEQERLLRIGLNKLGEQSDWDMGALSVEFGDLLAQNIDIDFEVTGFSTPEVDALLYPPAEQPQANDPDDSFAVVAGPEDGVARLNDLWLLGPHRVVCASTREAINLERLMAGSQARMVLTDHPYGVKISGHVSGLGKTSHREFVEGGAEMSDEAFAAFIAETTQRMASSCAAGALLYFFMDWRHMAEMLAGIRTAGLDMFNVAVWIKSTPAMGSFYRSQHELCFIAKKGGAAHCNNVQLGRFGRNRSNCWHYPGLNSFGAGRDEQLAMHPTCKNVAMLADAIRDATDRGDIVLDGFLGSGTTIIAAERTGRICYGLELDPLYVDTIVTRWEKATGGRATLDATGETYATVAERRRRERHLPDVNPRPRIRRLPVAA